MKHGYRKHQMERWSVGALERWSAKWKGVWATELLGPMEK